MTKRSKKTVNPLSVVQTWQIISAILGILLAGVALKAASSTMTTTHANIQTLGEEMISFVNQNLLNGQMTATLDGVKEVHGVVQLNLTIAGKHYTSYVTKDGALFFISAIDVKQVEGSKPQQQTQTTTVTKSSRPDVELFVMSYCPYGTQIEKGILPVLKTLGNKINFQLKFVNYAMHGEKEVKENTYQYCIQKEFPDKLVDYLYCFLDKGDRTSCITKVGIDSQKLENCYKETDSEYNITGLYNDKSTWSNGRFPPFPIYNVDNVKYSVRGSPTLIINGKQVQSGRSPASLLSSICSAFNTTVEECNTQLSTTTPSPGFGFDSTGQDTTASCG